MWKIRAGIFAVTAVARRKNVVLDASPGRVRDKGTKSRSNERNERTNHTNVPQQIYESARDRFPMSS